MNARERVPPLPSDVGEKHDYGEDDMRSASLLVMYGLGTESVTGESVLTTDSESGQWRMGNGRWC